MYGPSTDYVQSNYGVTMEYLWSNYGVSTGEPPSSPLFIRV